VEQTWLTFPTVSNNQRHKMPDIYINTDRTIDRSIVAGINQPQREAPIGALVAGSSYDTNLYFVRNDGTYDPASGASGQSVEVTISAIAEPRGGTFTLTDILDTTAEIEFGASASTLQSAINELNNGAGIDLAPVNYFSTDGGTDRGINADLSEYPLTDSGTLPSVRVTGWVKPVGTEAAFTFNTGWGITLSGLTAGVWQLVDFTNNKDFGTLDTFRVSYNEEAGVATACSFSDIRVMDNNANDALIARYHGDEAPSGNLDGVTAVDSSSNGYDGTYIGCDGGRESIPEQKSQVVVEKIDDTHYHIELSSKGEADALSGSSVSLYPESTPTASIAVTGSATQNAQQIIEINRVAAVTQSTWTEISNGFNATISLDSVRLKQSLSLLEQPFYINVKLNGEVVAREVVQVLPSI
jgi:hypothetical protein